MQLKMKKKELPSTHDMVVYIHNECVKHLEDLGIKFNVTH